MEMGGEGGPCGLAPEGSQGEARDPTGRTTAGTYNDLHMAVRTDRHQAKQDAQELFDALPEDARNSLLGTKTATRTPLKTKPSVQSTGDTAKPDDVDAKEQPTLQDTDGVSMMNCFTAPRNSCAACEGQNKYSQRLRETKEASGS